MTTDDKTPDPSPALLSAARLAEIRERWVRLATAIAIDRDLTPDEEVESEQDIGALLAHLDALTPRAPVDGNAGRRLYYALHPTAHERAWESHDAELRARYDAQAAALHAIGHAAGRSEGEAERAASAHKAASVNGLCLNMIAERDVEIARVTEECDAERVAVLERDATIARLTAALADLDVLYQEQVRESQRLAADRERMEDERDAATAELAEARADRSHGPIADAALLAAKLYHDADNQSVQLAQIRAELDACRQEVAAARLDGAREEREAILLRLSHLRETWTNMNEGDALFVLAQIVGAIEERGPTPTKENSR